MRLQMSANNAHARHNGADYVVHIQDIVTPQVRCLRSHNKKILKMQILEECFFVIALNQSTRLLLRQCLEPFSPKFVCRHMVIVNAL
jgi:hypothetical protein